MTDVMRDMIAQLMGAQRAEEEGRSLPPFDHHSVCRAYLLESCPREILSDTRLESFMSCRKIHEPAHKADYNTAQAKKDLFYDIEAFEAIEDAVKVVDYEVNKIKDKIKRDTENMQDSHEYIKTQKIFELNEKIGTALVQVESLGNEGKVHESMELMKSVEEMKRKKRELETEMRAIAPVQQRLRVCEACGAQLNILDHESRLQDHYGGKMHLGMIEIREKYEEMKKTVKDRIAEKRKADDEDRDSRRRRDKGRDRDDSRDRRRRSRSRSRSRSRKRSRTPKKSSKSSRRSRTPESSSSRKSSRRDSSRERRRSDRR